MDCNLFIFNGAKLPLFWLSSNEKGLFFAKRETLTIHDLANATEINSKSETIQNSKLGCVVKGWGRDFAKQKKSSEKQAKSIKIFTALDEWRAN
jgi:hypothetical protein